MQLKYDQQSHFFQYLQVRHYIQANIPQYLTKPKTHVIYDANFKQALAKELNKIVME